MQKSNIKSINTTTFQLRLLDSVGGYKFALMTGNNIDSKTIDAKL